MVTGVVLNIYIYIYQYNSQDRSGVRTVKTAEERLRRDFLKSKTIILKNKPAVSKKH